MDATRQTAPRTCWSPDVEKDELLGLARRFFTASGALLRYAREASYHV